MGRVFSCKPLGMHTIYITNLAHETSNENGRGTHTVSFTGSHTHIQRQKVGLVLFSQTDKTDVGYTYRISLVRCHPQIVTTHNTNNGHQHSLSYL